LIDPGKSQKIKGRGNDLQKILSRSNPSHGRKTDRRISYQLKGKLYHASSDTNREKQDVCRRGAQPDAEESPNNGRGTASKEVWSRCQGMEVKNSRRLSGQAYVETKVA